MSDPLLNTLFRPTSLSPRLASAAPVREQGSHTRAGNAMNRTRAALLAGAREAVLASGTKITMAQVAAAAGVAKATLYNHFRTRDAVLAALVEHEVSTLVATLAERPLADALRDAALAVAGSPVVRALAVREPATLARLATVDTSARGWQLARDAVMAALGGRASAGSAIVLRWLSSYLTTSASASDVAAEAAMLLDALPAAGTESAVTDARTA